MTKRLVEAGKLLGIEVLDHLVVNSDNSLTGLKERGYLRGEITPFFFEIYYVQLLQMNLLKYFMIEWN